MEWKVGIQSAELSGALSEVEEHLTVVKDQLLILEADAQQLEEFWKGVARVQWLKGLHREYNRLNQQIAAICRQELMLKKMALSLIKQEQAVCAMLESL